MGEHVDNGQRRGTLIWTVGELFGAEPKSLMGSALFGILRDGVIRFSAVLDALVKINLRISA